MADWEFWKGFASGAAIVLAIVFWLAKGIAAIESILPKRPKLKIEVKDCSIAIGRFPAWFWGEKVQFILLVNNTGSRNCSVTSVKLILPDRNFADLKAGKSTTLPLLVSTDKPEEIRMCGLCRKWEKLNDANDVPKRPDMFPKQDSIEATILININTKKHPIKRLATFAISHPPKKDLLSF